VTILSGSFVPKLAIVGDASTVIIEDGADVGRIDFWGTGNQVTIPDNLDPIVASVGVNRVIRRPVERATTQPAHDEAGPVGDSD
jgi:hypothetical protein